MGDPHAMGTMATPRELLLAMKAIGAIDRLPTGREQLSMADDAGGRVLWRLVCAHHLAGAVEAQVLMAGGTAAEAGAEGTAILQAGWDVYSGANIDEDNARVGLLAAIADRLASYLLVMTAHIRRGDAVEELSPLVMVALPIAGVVCDLLKAAANETAGDDQPRADFPKLTASLRDMADLLDTMTPKEQG
jgi:hypothetical protein